MLKLAVLSLLLAAVLVSEGARVRRVSFSSVNRPSTGRVGRRGPVRQLTRAPINYQDIDGYPDNYGRVGRRGGFREEIRGGFMEERRGGFREESRRGGVIRVGGGRGDVRRGGSRGGPLGGRRFGEYDRFDGDVHTAQGTYSYDGSDVSFDPSNDFAGPRYDARDFGGRFDPRDRRGDRMVYYSS